jgi:hypothetical protein
MKKEEFDELMKDFDVYAKQFDEVLNALSKAKTLSDVFELLLKYQNTPSMLFIQVFLQGAKFGMEVMRDAESRNVSN